MWPRSKWLRALLIVVPLVIVALLWQSARQRPRFVATPVPAQALALSHDGARLAFSIQSEEVFWREKGVTHKLPATSASPGYPPGGFPPALQFGRDGRSVYRTTSNTPHVFRWDLATNSITWSAISASRSEFTDFALSRDGRHLARRAYAVIQVFDVSGAGAPQKILPGNAASRFARGFPVLFRHKIDLKQSGGGYALPADIALSSDGNVLILAEPSGSLQFWNVAAGNLTLQTTPLPSVSGTITQLKPSPDGRFVALCDDVGVALWSAQTHKWTRDASTTVVALHDIAWMPDSRSLWTSSFVIPNSDNDKVQRLSVPDLKPLRVLPAWGPIAVSGDGHTLATRDNAQKGVWLWNID